MDSTDVFLKADWRFLAMLNYEVDAEMLSPFVPPGTRLDQWHGKNLVSLVGFQFLNTKVRGISFPFHRNFEEVNLRFYVRRTAEGEDRRGVVFIKEIVPRWIIAAMARRFYNENYVALPMSHSIDGRDVARISVHYGWKSGQTWSGLGLLAKGNAQTPEAGSEQHFITEHYWGYTSQRDGGCMEYRVSHPQWKVWNAESPKWEGDMSALYGADFAVVLSRPPVSAFLAEGSEVLVHRGRKL
jgi:uncharacterized protein